LGFQYAFSSFSNGIIPTEGWITPISSEEAKLKEKAQPFTLPFSFFASVLASFDFHFVLVNTFLIST